MAKLKEKISHSLDECRILVLGAQVLVGFYFQSAFQPGFVAIGRGSQSLLLGALILMLVALALLIAPAGYHCIVERGEDTPRFHHYVTRMAGLALLPFALGLVASLYVSIERTGAGPGLRTAGAARHGTASTLFMVWLGADTSGISTPETEDPDGRQGGQDS